ncbi:MAG: NUMOD3 domain-containing DNA-binding protein [Bacteroidales bacterium]|jgi:hypothetical protein
MSTTFKPYTYLIGWSSLNKFYYGVQYGTKANPKNLWTTYFTSSKYVKEFREFYGEPDIIQVRKVFETKEKAIQWEFKIIQRMKIVSSSNWLNRSLAGQKFYNTGGFIQSEETKKKISVATKGKNGKKGILNPMYGKFHTEETKKKLSISHKNKILTDEHKYHIGLSGIGRIHTSESKDKMRQIALNRNKKHCIFCNNYYDPGNYSKSHGNKCKKFTIID